MHSGAEQSQDWVLQAPALLDAVSELVCVVGPDAGIRWANEAWGRELGLAPADLIGRTLLDLVHPDDAERLGIELLSLQDRPGATDGFECRMLGPQARVRRLRWRPQPMPDGCRAFSGREAADRRGGPRLDRDSLLDRALDGIVSAGADGRIVEFNPSAERMFGLARGDALGADLTDLIVPPAARAAHRAGFERVAAGGPMRLGGRRLELEAMRADGSLFPAELTVTQTSAEPFVITAFIRDITERRAAEDALRRSEARLSRTQVLARIGAWCWDLVEDRFSWTEGLDGVFGPMASRSTSGGLDFLEFVHPGDRDRVRRLFEDALAGHAAQTWEYRVLTPSGEVQHLFAWGELVHDEDGRIARLHGYAQDITRLRLAEGQAARARRDNEQILDAAGEGILRLDADTRVLFANPAAISVLGHPRETLMGAHLHELVHHSFADGMPYPLERCPMRRTSQDGQVRRVTDDVFWRADGSAMPVEYTCAPIWDGERLSGVVVVFSDVTRRRELEAELRRLAEVDGLTGLANRRVFERALDECLASGDGRGALLLLDLDHFKFVNDSFGHAVGDDLLRAVATVIERETRPADTLARLGGDEFAVLLPGAGPQEADAIAQRLIAGLDAARPSGLHVGMSIGATCFEPGRRTTSGDLMVAADIALYEAKGAGRGRVVSYSGRPGASLTWVERIRAALAEDRFRLFSQPIVDLATGETVHEELLLRMLDEQGGVVPPNSFLPTAESFGLIGDIDRWVLLQGIELAAEGRRVHVNLSGVSVGSMALLDELEAGLRRTGADPANVVIELTETLAVANIAEAGAFADRLRAIGCGLALDDFGTGFGSFTYLMHLPADYLKIDMEFVRGLADGGGDLRVVEAIVGIAERFGCKAIAEGVEDEATMDLLRAAGVGFAQGYHLGRPAPVRAD